MNRAALDLFAGCGGLTSGLKAAGFVVKGAVELDGLAARTYSTNHPDVELFPVDIRQLDVLQLSARTGLKPGCLDLLSACPPCQGFSSIRTLNGSRKENDPRNDLLSEVTRFAEALLPECILLENVPGILKSAQFIEFTQSLERLGYISNSAVLNAHQFGVPQRRRRFVLIAGLGRRFELPEPTGAVLTVRSAIGHLPPPAHSDDPLHNYSVARSQQVTRRIRAIPKNGGSRIELPHRLQLPCHRETTGFKDVYGRMSWDRISPTITGGCINPSKGRFLHPTQNRAITLREAATLQGFPDDYYFCLDDGRYKAAAMIGNAFPPALAYANAAHILSQLERP